MIRLGTIVCFLGMWFFVGYTAYGATGAPSPSISDETPISLKLFIGALVATTLFVWKLSRIHSKTEKRLDCLEKKLDALSKDVQSLKVKEK